MRLYEYESKRILQGLGVAIPRGRLATTPDECRAAAQEIGGPVVLKAQILATGRGKAGGIRFAATPAEAEQAAHGLLGMPLKGYTVQQLLVEEQVPAARELYAAATYEERTKGRVVLASEAGGVDLNEAAEQEPGCIECIRPDAFLGLQPFQARELAFNLALPAKANAGFQALLLKLWDAFVTYDAILAEVNPVAVTEDGRVVALDAHLVLDDDALFRQRERLAALGIADRDDNTRPPTPFEVEALRIDKGDYRGVAGRVVEFPGNLGLLIGAGGGSLTLFDAVLRNGGRPANYCEVGGNPPVSKVYRLCRLILQKPGVKGLAVMTNVFSNSRVDFLARGVIKAMLELGINPASYPIVFRSAGAFEDDAYAILRQYGVRYFGREVTLEDAARAAVRMVAAL